MSLANLKKMKKELLLINKNNNKHKLLIQALDGLFLIDLSKIDERRVAPVDEAPEGMDIEIIGANIDDVLVCGGVGYEPVIIVNDIPEDDIVTNDDLLVLNIVPTSKDT